MAALCFARRPVIYGSKLPSFSLTGLALAQNRLSAPYLKELPFFIRECKGM